MSFIMTFIDEVKRRRAMRVARPYFLSQLTSIFGKDAEITPGDYEFDYFVPVPVHQLEELGMRVTRLTFEVQERFGVYLSALPIPYE
jgi:hypothetical protein